jgi:hypothetical protein
MDEDGARYVAAVIGHALKGRVRRVAHSISAW